jgi:hypothetical protein
MMHMGSKKMADGSIVNMRRFVHRLGLRGYMTFPLSKVEEYARNEHKCREYRGLFFNVVAMVQKLAYLRSGKRLEFELLFVKFMAVSIGLAGYTLPTHGVVVPAAFLRPPHKLDTKEALARTMAAARRGRIPCPYCAEGVFQEKQRVKIIGASKRGLQGEYGVILHPDDELDVDGGCHTWHVKLKDGRTMPFTSQDLRCARSKLERSEHMQTHACAGIDGFAQEAVEAHCIGALVELLQV